MAHAEKCPVCYGSGKIAGKKCHGCGGKGWVQIGDDVVFPPKSNKESEKPKYTWIHK